MNNSKKLKAIVLSMGLGVAMLASTSVQAQLIDQRGERPNGLFQGNSQNDGLMRCGGNRSVGSTLNNESFGAPIGGGIGILLAAGMGYAFIQSKKNKQN
jgi:hypothetical protein